MPETWILCDENWALPVSVDWPGQQDMAGVRYIPGFPLLNIQREAIAARLQPIGMLREDAWWVLREHLEVIASPTTEDPERVVIWRPVEARVKYRSGPHNTNRDEFFAEMARTSIINDPVKCEVLWVSFCKVVLSWMLNNQRPVPMGFCDLYAVPMRPNWKQIIFQKQQGRQTAGGKAKLNRTQLAESSVNKLIDRGTGDDLLDPKLLFWCKKDEHMYWSIEARPKNMWWRMVKALELAKKKKRRGGFYLAGIADTMKRLLPQTLDLYASFLQQASLPFIRLASTVRSSGGQFKKGRSLVRLVGEARFAYQEPATYVRREGGEESVTLADVPSSAFMSSLSDIQQERLSVRDARADLEKSQNGTA